MRSNDSDSRVRAIAKILSSNDTGETGGHQAGTHIPKTSSALTFFPELKGDTKNPRVALHFMDQQGKEWRFSFIYYNSKFFGGTRNEYRLTGMTRYFKKYGLKAGDRLILHRDESNGYRIEYIKSAEQPEDVLFLRNTWKVIHI
jgi:hypothetical protein